MKGLIYKDYIICRKMLAMAYFYCFFFAVMAMLVRISMICGNLADNKEVLDSLTRNIWLLRYVPCVAFMAASCMQSTYSDKNCGWLRFCFTTSVGEKRIIGAKMLFDIAQMTTAYVISILYLLIFLIAEGGMPKLSHFRYITACYFLFLSFSFLITLLSVVCKKKQTVDMIMVGIASAIMLSIMPALLNKMESLEGNQDIDVLDFISGEISIIKSWLLPGAFVLAVVMGVSCYIFSVKVLKRREN